MKFWSLDNLWFLLVASLVTWQASREFAGYALVLIFVGIYGLCICNAYLRLIYELLAARKAGTQDEVIRG